MLGMLAISVLIATTVVVLCAAVYATAAHMLPAFAPATVGPFAPGTGDPAADTLSGQAEANTVFVDDGWKSVTLNRLCDVEDLLDQLEAHNVTEREMITLGNAAFCVRWK